MSKPINKSLRGIRDSIPGGFILGRTGKGNGPPILLPVSTFASKTYVANTTIQVGGPAGGDLSGTYPNPTVAKIQGNAVKVAVPTDGQVLEWVNANSDWEPTTPTANPTATAGDTAVNGTAKTMMRSDGAPAVRIATTGQTGLVKPDGTTITIAPNGTISSTGGSGGSSPPGLDQIIDRDVLNLLNGGSGGGGGGGFPVGTPPTVVQSAFSTSGGNSVVLGTAPTNGNLLVAMGFNPTSDTAGSGWTRQVDNSTGTDFGLILTKVAGAGESTTQSPLSGVSTTGALIVWEIHGQASSGFFLAGASQTEQSGTSNTPILFPNCKNCLGLSAVGLVPSPTFQSVANIGTQSVLSNTNSRFLAAGYTDLSQTPMVGILSTFSGIASSKGATCLITS